MFRTKPRPDTRQTLAREGTHQGATSFDQTLAETRHKTNFN